MSIFDRFKKKEPPKPYKRKISVVMPDGTVDEYPEDFIITDKTNCIVCNSNYYHFKFDCCRLQWEKEHGDDTIKGMTIKDAKKAGKSVCDECDHNLYLFNHGRLEGYNYLFEPEEDE